jgi:hypothetical protein
MTDFSAPSAKKLSDTDRSCVVMDGPASCTYPALRARRITTSPSGVGIPVVMRISLVTSPSRSISLAVAIRVPSRTKMPGFSVPVTTSVDSPSRPMEVSPSVPRRWPPVSSQLSMVVLPAFLHMPTMDMVFVSLSRRISSSCMEYTPFLFGHHRTMHAAALCGNRSCPIMRYCPYSVSF